VVGLSVLGSICWSKLSIMGYCCY